MRSESAIPDSFFSPTRHQNACRHAFQLEHLLPLIDLITINMMLPKILTFSWLASMSLAFVIRQPAPQHQLGAAPSRETTSLAMGLTLYGSQGSRSPLVNWALYELGLDFDMGDLSENPHPFAQIPCLTDDNDVIVFESGAILLYVNSLSDQELNEAQNAQVMSWVSWANASLDPICFLETPDGKVCVCCMCS